jgi:DNA replication protein DnaC
LKVAKAKGTIETELRKIEWCLLLILEDLFLVPLDAKEHPVLLDIIENRHGRKSIISLHKSRYPTGMTPSETRPCQMRYWSGLYTRRTKLN